MATKKKVTFRQIVEQTRLNAAEAAWKRAKDLSRLRRHEIRAGRHRSALRLSKWKADAIQLALTLAPEQIAVTIDEDYQVGLLSIRWRGQGKLHLPADTQLV